MAGKTGAAASTGDKGKDHMLIWAERGATIRLQELKDEIAELHKTFPALGKSEQEEKRRATMMAKYGTTNPVEAAAKAKAIAKALGGGGAKKSHHKKPAVAATAIPQAPAQEADESEAEGSPAEHEAVEQAQGQNEAVSQ